MPPDSKGRPERAAFFVPSVPLPETSSCYFPPPFWLRLGLSRLFKCVILRLLYLRVVNIHSVTILLFFCAREGRAGILMKDIHRWGWFLSFTHGWKIHGE